MGVKTRHKDIGTTTHMKQRGMQDNVFALYVLLRLSILPHLK